MVENITKVEHSNPTITLMGHFSTVGRTTKSWHILSLIKKEPIEAKWKFKQTSKLDSVSSKKSDIKRPTCLFANLNLDLCVNI